MKRIITISLCMAALLSCRPAEQKSAAPADIPVGVYAATSGSEAAFGQATVQGEQLAAEEINRNGGVLGRKHGVFGRVDDRHRRRRALGGGKHRRLGGRGQQQGEDHGRYSIKPNSR